jgi:hypothetical protein
LNRRIDFSRRRGAAGRFKQIHFYNLSLPVLEEYKGSYYGRSLLTGWAMMRYFFDLGTDCTSMYDHQGRDFATPEDAYQLAELIALDLEVNGEWNGWAVAVRNPKGQQIFLIPVRSAELVDR